MPTRPRRVPERSCVACRQTRPKRELTRVVRAVDGSVEVDPTGKRSGRGAYLCRQAACWEQALKKRALDRALKIELTEEQRARLRASAPEQMGTAVASGGEDESKTEQY